VVSSGIPPTVSAVVVHFGLWSSTVRTVASLQRHAPGAQIVVVNNDPGSTVPPDLGAPVLDSPANIGYGAACNLGARSFPANLFLFANNDVEILPGSVRELESALEEDSGAAAAGPRFTEGDGTPRRSVRRPPSPWRILCENLLLPRLLPYVPLFQGHHTVFARQGVSRKMETLLGALFLIRRDAFESVGGFDEAYFFYAEESDLFARLRGAGWSVVYRPASRVVHHESVASRSVDRETLDRWLIEGLTRYARRFHGPAGERRAAAALRAGARLRWLLSFAPGLSDLERRRRYATLLRMLREERGADEQMVSRE
jgi:GT2 family glycosyltransferase